MTGIFNDYPQPKTTPGCSNIDHLWVSPLHGLLLLLLLFSLLSWVMIRYHARTGRGTDTDIIRRHEPFLKIYNMIRQIGHHYDIGTIPSMKCPCILVDMYSLMIINSGSTYKLGWSQEHLDLYLTCKKKCIFIC